jgi:uncharacterized membrane protein YfcA
VVSEKERFVRALTWKKYAQIAAIILFVGFFVGFGSGLIENRPDSESIPGNKYYGFPLVWRMVEMESGTYETYVDKLFLDIAFGWVIIAVVAAAAMITMKRMNRKEQIPTKRKNKPQHG